MVSGPWSVGERQQAAIRKPKILPALATSPPMKQTVCSAGSQRRTALHDGSGRWLCKDVTTVLLNDLLTRALDMKVEVSGAEQFIISDVCCDSRAATPGCLFVAIRGGNFNGEDYIPDAISKGAAAIVVDQQATIGPPETGPARTGRGSGLPPGEAPVWVRVADTRHALARLASAFFGLDQLQSGGGYPAVGITGTNGKSTIACLMRGIFRAAGRSSALLGTIEYDLVGRKAPSGLTTPDAVDLARLLVEAHTFGADCFVMEASSHSLEQCRTDGIRFDVGVFTNLTRDHLNHHGTMENYRLAKRRLFDHLDERAAAVINVDDPAGLSMVEACRAKVIRYGIEQPAEVRAVALREDRDGTRFVLQHGSEAVEVATPLVGRHNVYNCLAAAAAGIALGIDPTSIRRGIADVALVRGRMERVLTGDLGFDVFVDYAHTDDALRNVLRAARRLTHGRLWCVFGCGGERDRPKRPLMAKAVAELADCFIITSDNPRREAPLQIIAEIERGLTVADASRKETIPDRRKAIHRAIRQLEPGDTLIIAGKGHEDYQEIGTDRIHFDDVEVAREAVKDREGKVHAAAHVA